MNDLSTNNTRYAVILLALSFAAPLSWATDTQSKALLSSPSVADLTGGDGWGFAAGIGLEYEAAYDPLCQDSCRVLIEL